jgi:hypothetical protein
MRRLIIGTALWFATIAGGIALAGSNAHAATAPAVDDWPVSRTVVGQMYYDADALVLASAGGCTSAATDDSCG